MLAPPRFLSKDRLSGYPLARFVTPPSIDFLCVLCGFVVREPLECKKCSKLFCTLCLFCKDRPNPEISIDIHCPSCGPESKPQKPSKVLARIINELQIFCKFQENGCLEKTSVRKISSHESLCKYKVVSCENLLFCAERGLAYRFIETQVAMMRNGAYVCSKKCKKLMKFQNCVSQNNYGEAVKKYFNCLKKGSSAEGIKGEIIN